MKIRRKFSRLATCIFILLASFATPVLAAEPIQGISAHGQKAIEQISTCINSESKNTLNVLYLVDESASLRQTDAKSLRVDGLRASLEQFRNVSIDRPYFTVNRSITTFANDYSIQKDWQVLDNGQLENDLDWIRNSVPTLNSGTATDWLTALTNAYSQFEKKKSTTSCDVMVWFTDGAIDVKTLSATSKAVKSICGSDPLTGVQTGEPALIDKFRRAGINIQGVLLKNDEYFSNPEKYEATKEEAESNRMGMSYFLPILEANGTVDSGYFGGTGKRELKCGQDFGAAGVLQTIGDPLDIIWFPVPFNCLATNGRILPVVDELVAIDAGMTRFQVTTPKDGFTLANSDGTAIAVGANAAKAQVQITPLGQSNSIISVSGNISDSGILKPGTWKFKTSQPNRAVFCGYLDLQVEIKGKTCYENEDCKFSGRISRNGRKVDFSVFGAAPKLSYSALKTDGSESTRNTLALNSTDGSYEGSYSTRSMTDGKGISRLKINLDVVTKSGYEFSISAIKDFAVIPPGLYPEVTPNPILKSDFKQGLIGKQGNAFANVILAGPSRTDGEICFGALQVRTDPLPKRIPEYASSLDGKDLANSVCFKVKAGEKSPVVLSIKNSQSADGTVSGFVNLTLKSDGQPDVTSKIDIEFETSEKHDAGKFWFTFLLIMFLGFGIPLALFYLVNALGAQIQLSTLSLATVPMILTASGGFVNLKRKEPGKSSGLLNYDDFNGFKHAKEKVKEVNIGSENLRGRAPKNPFGRIRAILTTAPGYVVVSSELSNHTGKGLLRNQTDAALNPSGKMHLALSESALAAIKKQNQGVESDNQTIEASLVAVMGFSSLDPNQEIETLNMALSSQTGWLDKLLKYADPISAKPLKKKNAKKSKGDEGTSGIVGGGAPNAPDDWGPPSSMNTPGAGAHVTPHAADDGWGTTSASKDDWGSKSGNTDWDSSSGHGSTSNESW